MKPKEITRKMCVKGYITTCTPLGLKGITQNIQEIGKSDVKPFVRKLKELFLVYLTIK